MSDKISETRLNVKQLIEDLNTLDRSFHKGTTALSAMLRLTRRLNLPESMDEGIRKMQEMIAVANMLRATMLMLQTATGPYGWLMAGISIGESLLILADVS